MTAISTAEELVELMIKRPGYLSDVTARGGALDEETGAMLARWAGPPQRKADPFVAVKRDLMAARCLEDLVKPAKAIRAGAGGSLTPEQQAELRPILEEQEAVLLPRAEQGSADPDADGR